MCEASKVAQGSFLKFRSACASAVWSRRVLLARSGTVLSMLDGPVGCDQGFGIVCNRFRMMRRFLAYWLGEVLGVMRLIGFIADGAPGHGLVRLFVAKCCQIGFPLE